MSNLLLVREPGHSAPAGARVDYAIRPLPRDELPLVADAYFTSYRDTPDAFPLEEAVADIAATAAGEYGSYQPDLSAVALTSSPSIRNERVGAILVARDAPYPDVPSGLFIVDLFVTPAHRGRGLGKDLVLHTIAAASSDPLWLRVDADNSAALALYSALGFAPQR